MLLPTQAKTALPLLLLKDVSHEPAQVKAIGESILEPLFLLSLYCVYKVLPCRALKAAPVPLRQVFTPELSDGFFCVLENGCSLLLNHNGPFTAFIPLLRKPLTVSWHLKQHLFLHRNQEHWISLLRSILQMTGVAKKRVISCLNQSRSNNYQEQWKWLIQCCWFFLNQYRASMTNWYVKTIWSWVSTSIKIWRDATLIFMEEQNLGAKETRYYFNSQLPKVKMTSWNY